MNFEVEECKGIDGQPVLILKEGVSRIWPLFQDSTPGAALKTYRRILASKLNRCRVELAQLEHSMAVVDAYTDKWSV